MTIWKAPPGAPSRMTSRRRTLHRIEGDRIPGSAQSPLGRHSLPIKRAVTGRRNIPAEGSGHRAAAHRVKAILGHEGRKRAPDAAEEGLGRWLREQEAGFAVGDGFRQPAGLMADRERSELLRVHLAQPAWFKPRRHQRKIAAGEDPPRLAVVESDGDPDRIRPAADSTRSMPFWCTRRATRPKIGPRDNARPNCW